LQFCVDRRGGDELKHLDTLNIDIDEGDVRLAYHGSNGILGGAADRYFTRLVGKRIISPPPVEKAGLPPFDGPQEYSHFIIGIDAEGDAVEHTCDPDQLANYFGKNPDAPHFLTPVFFRRDAWYWRRYRFAITKSPSRHFATTMRSPTSSTVTHSPASRSSYRSQQRASVTPVCGHPGCQRFRLMRAADCS